MERKEETNTILGPFEWVMLQDHLFFLSLCLTKMRSGGRDSSDRIQIMSFLYLMYINSRQRYIYSLADDPAALMLHCIRSGRPSGNGINFLLYLQKKDTRDSVYSPATGCPTICIDTVPFNSIRNQIKWNYILRRPMK